MNALAGRTAERLDTFEKLIQMASGHFGMMRGTIYEKYTEDMLESVITEKEEFITHIVRSN
ncbi:MAG: hypothetical protein K8I29_15345 [Alphaproteobacteria bacterium]|uniref:Uncharacterized protein n=1 Tax=Candidatus Nitrobium versatile TaxID=2884831 RepID=A0A953J6X8_9BACT|nr:hypothetical protein [Candidatus Nitrobium versatile]